MMVAFIDACSEALDEHLRSPEQDSVATTG